MPTVSRRKRRHKLAAGAAAVLGAAIVPEASAAAIQVNSTSDAVAVDSQCTLREAIVNANDDAATNADCAAGLGADTITFTLASLPATIVLGGTSIDITADLTITGPGQTNLTIDANNASRIFNVDDGTGAAIAVGISDLTLINGDSSSESIPGGGAILNSENLTLTNVTASNNYGQCGGVIESSYGNLTVTGSTLTQNDSIGCGGAISFANGNFTLSNTSVTQNTAGTSGGGIALLYSYLTTITNATITGNTATIGNGGGLYFYAPQDLTTIEDSVISGNVAGTVGGGMMMLYGALEGDSLIVRDTEISGNTGTDSGGGVLLAALPGYAHFERVRVLNNTAADYSGGVGLLGVNTTIVESEISGNQAAHGGGLYAGYNAYLYMINSTVANNTAPTSGGGLSINGSFAQIDLTTISGNTSAGAGGNLFSYGSFVDIENSIIANGTAPVGPDISESTSSISINYSLVEDPTGGPAISSPNLTGDPGLGPLQNNGGPTQTLKPLTGSPVINAGDPAFTTPPDHDQRLLTRPIGQVDMGAVEVNPGTVALNPTTYNVNEAGGFATITVTRTGGSDGAVSVNYLTGDGSAIAPGDYTSTNGTLTWADADTATKSFQVPIINDTTFEGNETFNVALLTPVGATLGAAEGSVTIIDNDSAPTILIDDPSATEGSPVTFTVSLSNPTIQTVTVTYATNGGSAQSGPDFLPAGGMLTFPPLVTTQPIPVTTINDPVDEPNETFTVTLTNPTNATIADDTGTGTILDNDGAPSLSIDNVTLPEGNAGTTNFTFTVTLSPASGQTVTVDYTTQNGSAVAPGDYATNANTLTFLAGETSKQIVVSVAGDTAVEPNETFTVVLSNAPLATIGTGTGTGTITNDDTAVADLSLTKAIGTGPYTVGQPATFTITVTNNGPDIATNVHVLDTLPAGVNLVTATPSSGTCSGTVTVDCNVGTLLNGSNATVTLIVQFTQTGTVTNIATANSDVQDPSGASGSVTFTVSAPANGEPIPTLSEWMLIALASALAAAAALKLRP